MKIYNSIQRWIAERLFENILDEDFSLGTQHGHEVSLASSILRLKVALNNSTKKDAPGLEKAIAELEALR